MRDAALADAEEPDAGRVGQAAPRAHQPQAPDREDHAGRDLHRTLQRHLEPTPARAPAGVEGPRAIVSFIKATVSGSSPFELRIHAGEQPLEILIAPTREHPRHDSQIVASHKPDTTPTTSASTRPIDKVTTINLEPWRKNDLPLLQRLMGDAEMTRYLGGPETDEKLRSRLARYITYQHPESRMFKIVVDGAPAGSVGYWDNNWQGKDIYETGWMVVPEFQGRGIAVKATELAIERAKQEERRSSIHAFPSVENTASNRICEKLGFELQGEHDFEFPPGHWMKCNDWSLELTAHPRRARSEHGKEEGPP